MSSVWREGSFILRNIVPCIMFRQLHKFMIGASLMIGFHPAADCQLIRSQSTAGQPQDSIGLYPGHFRQDPHWHGADGAATVDLGSGRVLWLFSDSFVSTDSLKDRSRSRIIRNSIAIQKGYRMDTATIQFFYRQQGSEPADYFTARGHEWYWMGPGICVDGKLIVFLFTVKATNVGLGFEATGWEYAVVDNPTDSPEQWNIQYHKGLHTPGMIAGSSAVLKQGPDLLLYAVSEPGTQEVYLLKLPARELLSGKITHASWWTGTKWQLHGKGGQSRATALFHGATEFSVHYDSTHRKFIQVQAQGFGDADIVARTAPRPEGPWSEPVVLFHPPDRIPGKIVYTARAHPALKPGLLITYNINSLDFEVLLRNNEIYYPRFIRVDPGRWKNLP